MKKIMFLVSFCTCFSLISTTSAVTTVFLKSICENNEVRPLKFASSGTPEEIHWPEDRKKLQEIRAWERIALRSSTTTRPKDINFHLGMHTFPVTAGYARKHGNPDELNYPDGLFPFSEAEDKILNYAFDPKRNADDSYKLKEVKNPSKGGYFYALDWDKYPDLFKPIERFPKTIKSFAKNMIVALKGVDIGKFDVIPREQAKIAGVILTSEYFRAVQSLAIAYIEFYKLKLKPEVPVLSNLYQGAVNLVFTGNGGAKIAMRISSKELKRRLFGMWKLKYETLKQQYKKFKLPELPEKSWTQEFFKRKLDNLKVIYFNLIPSLTSSSAAVISTKHGKFIAFIESCRIHPEKTLADSTDRVELATRDAELSKDQAEDSKSLDKETSSTKVSLRKKSDTDVRDNEGKTRGVISSNKFKKKSSIDAYKEAEAFQSNISLTAINLDYEISYDSESQTEEVQDPLDPHMEGHHEDHEFRDESYYN